MRLESIDLEIINRCNLNCRYCYVTKPAEEIPADEWIKLMGELGKIFYLRDICLTGGEPFLHPELERFLSVLALYRKPFNILSNGSLITDDIAETIAKTGLCTGVQISVDGHTSEIHDSFRGPGAFDGAIRGIETLIRHDVPVHVRVTINKMNVHHLEDTIKFLLEDFGLPFVGTNSVDCIGACKEFYDEVSLTNQERSEAMKTLVNLNEKYPNRIQAAAGPLVEALWWKGLTSFGCGGKLTACGCVFNKLSVKSNGDIVPCMFLDDFVLGRINRDKVVNVFYASDILRRMRERQAIPLDKFPYCRDCSFITECTGGCPAGTYHMFRELDLPSLDGCRKRFLEEGGVLP